MVCVCLGKVHVEKLHTYGLHLMSPGTDVTKPQVSSTLFILCVELLRHSKAEEPSGDKSTGIKKFLSSQQHAKYKDSHPVKWPQASELHLMSPSAPGANEDSRCRVSLLWPWLPGWPGLREVEAELALWASKSSRDWEHNLHLGDCRTVALDRQSQGGGHPPGRSGFLVPSHPTLQLWKRIIMHRQVHIAHVRPARVLFSHGEASYKHHISFQCWIATA
jgi:hypothetical protein